MIKLPGSAGEIMKRVDGKLPASATSLQNLRTRISRRRPAAGRDRISWRWLMEKDGSEHKQAQAIRCGCNAEITYRCPLHCVFCYNPVDYATLRGRSCPRSEWLRVLRQARELGAVQLGFSGGEPLMRDDLEIMVAEARKLGYYTNLMTSGVGLTEKRIAAFKEGGLDHIQLSFQDSTREMNDFLSSTRTFELKPKVAKLIKQYDYPMVLNVVLHRLQHRPHHADPRDGGGHGRRARRARQHAVLRLGVHQSRPAAAEPRAIAARRRGDQPVPRARRQQDEKSISSCRTTTQTRPKACMNGWGSMFLNIAADGVALPCHEARMLPGLTFPNVRDHDLGWIWHESPASMPIAATPG